MTSVSTQKEVSLSPTALKYIEAQLNEQGQSYIGVRLGVKKVGCSGLTYVLNFVEQADQADQIFQITDKVCIVVANEHLGYLKGTQIDYEHTGIGGTMKFYNPNEKGACGCGESFFVEDTDKGD